MLLPGHRMLIEGGKEKIERYWSLQTNRNPDLRNLPYASQVKELKKLLEKSVKSHMVSDVPLGAFLSGGVDSSILVAMMSRISDNVRTFSVGFGEEGNEMDESGEALKTANFLNTNHSTVHVNGGDIKDNINKIVRGLDQPSVDGVNSFFVSKAAREATTVSISGTGGDELFAGYPWFSGMSKYSHGTLTLPSGRNFSKLFRSIINPHNYQFSKFRRMINKLSINENPQFSGFLRSYANYFRLYEKNVADNLLMQSENRVSSERDFLEFLFKSIDELPNGSSIERVTALCLRGYTNNQLLRDIDSVSMHHSLEVRVPFLDVTLVDFALSLPDESKLFNPKSVASNRVKTYRESGSKRILIDAARTLLPKDFDLQPKSGFGMPFDAWLKKDLKDILLETTRFHQVQNRGLLNPNLVEKISNDFLLGQRTWTQPWILMMLELWFREVFDKNVKLSQSDLDKIKIFNNA
jgi:asparagine synthase (glutamine-hydrolysing)